RDAVYDQRVYIVCAQFAKKAVDVLPGSVRVAIVGLGLDNVPVPRNALYGFAEIRIRPVLVGQIEEDDPAVKGVPHQPRERFLAQSRLIGLMVHANGAGSDSHYRHLETALAELHLMSRTLDRGIDCKSRGCPLGRIPELVPNQATRSDNTGRGHCGSDELPAAELLHDSGPPLPGSPGNDDTSAEPSLAPRRIRRGNAGPGLHISRNGET